MRKKLKSIAESQDLLISIATAKENGYTKKDYTIHIVTPMFGGGSKAGEVNAKNPVRASSIRGHLRFWWRATRGAVYENTYKLRQKETEIFGDTATPSSLKIWVDSESGKISLKNAKADKVNHNGINKFQFVDELPRYIAFPFDYKVKDPAIQFGYPYTFKLHIQLPSSKENLLESEILPALWAWINFGGIGARTRRGCGSLYCDKFSPEENENLAVWFKEKQQSYKLELPADDYYREWPVLRKIIKTKSIVQQELPRNLLNSKDAWKAVIDIYERFRRKSNGKMGRSYWPEADSIRKLTGMSEKKHENSEILEKNHGFAFPRAQLGLPIQFQFANRSGEVAGKRDPYKTLLKPKGKERLASPIIVKPLAVSEVKAYPAIFVLSQPRLEALELSWVNDRTLDNKPIDQKHFQEVSNDKKLIDQTIANQHIYVKSNYLPNKINPMKTSNLAEPSAVDAFLNSEEVLKWK